jgi:hypothetical protein
MKHNETAIAHHWPIGQEIRLNTVEAGASVYEKDMQGQATEAVGYSLNLFGLCRRPLHKVNELVGKGEEA